MKPHLNVVTLGVSDLQRAVAFYRDGLGLRTRGIVGTEFKGSETEPAGSAAFFELDGGLMLSLYPRKDLALDANLPAGTPGAVQFSLGHAVASRQAVDELLQSAKAAGAVITDEPHDRPWGIYSGYFKDLDGHLWEIMWSPQLRVQE